MSSELYRKVFPLLHLLPHTHVKVPPMEVFSALMVVIVGLTIIILSA